MYNRVAERTCRRRIIYSSRTRACKMCAIGVDILMSQKHITYLAYFVRIPRSLFVTEKSVLR